MGSRTTGRQAPSAAALVVGISPVVPRFPRCPDHRPVLRKYHERTMVLDVRPRVSAALYQAVVRGEGVRSSYAGGGRSCGGAHNVKERRFVFCFVTDCGRCDPDCCDSSIVAACWI